MALPTELHSIIGDIQKMLPLYQSQKAVAKYVSNLEWNLKKLGEGSLDAQTWRGNTISDFSNIALLLTKDAPGQKFAAGFEERLAGIADPKAVEAAPTEDTPKQGVIPCPTEPAIEPLAAAPAQASTTVGSPTAPTSAPFDVKAFLVQKAAAAKEKLAWKTSAVDLCKLVGVDSSLAGRKAFASKIGMSEAETAAIGSEEGNEFFRSRIVGYLAENSGILP